MFRETLGCQDLKEEKTKLPHAHTRTYIHTYIHTLARTRANGCCGGSPCTNASPLHHPFVFFPQYLIDTVQEVPPELYPHEANAPLCHQIPNLRHLHVEGTHGKRSCLHLPWQQQAAQVVVMVVLPGGGRGGGGGGGGGEEALIIKNYDSRATPDKVLAVLEGFLGRGGRAQICPEDSRELHRQNTVKHRHTLYLKSEKRAGLRSRLQKSSSSIMKRKEVRAVRSLLSQSSVPYDGIQDGSAEEGKDVRGWGRIRPRAVYALKRKRSSRVSRHHQQQQQHKGPAAAAPRRQDQGGGEAADSRYMSGELDGEFNYTYRGGRSKHSASAAAEEPPLEFLPLPPLSASSRLPSTIHLDPAHQSDWRQLYYHPDHLQQQHQQQQQQQQQQLQQQRDNVLERLLSLHKPEQLVEQIVLENRLRSLGFGSDSYNLQQQHRRQGLQQQLNLEGVGVDPRAIGELDKRAWLEKGVWLASQSGKGSQSTPSLSVGGHKKSRRRREQWSTPTLDWSSVLSNGTARGYYHATSSSDSSAARGAGFNVSRSSMASKTGGGVAEEGMRRGGGHMSLERSLLQTRQALAESTAYRLPKLAMPTADEKLPNSDLSPKPGVENVTNSNSNLATPELNAVPPNITQTPRLNLSPDPSSKPDLNLTSDPISSSLHQNFNLSPSALGTNHLDLKLNPDLPANTYFQQNLIPTQLNSRHVGQAQGGVACSVGKVREGSGKLARIPVVSPSLGSDVMATESDQNFLWHQDRVKYGNKLRSLGW